MNKLISDIKNEMPLVSVIIPSYNHEKYIEEAVRSVWSQTYNNVELIVIDDGSTDRSVEILNRLEKLSPIYMKVIKKKNEGVCKALNLGLSMATGKYISVLGSDDRYLEHKLDILTSIIEKTNDSISFIYSKNSCINEDGNCIDLWLPPIPKTKEDLFEEILLFKIFPTICSTLIKKNILVDLGGFNENYKAEDLDLLLRLTRNHKALFHNQTTWQYRVNVMGSLSRKIAHEDTIAIFKENIKFAKKSINPFWSQYAYARLYLRISESYYIIDELKQSKHWAAKSIFRNPFQYKAYRLYVPSLFGLKAINYFRNHLHKTFKTGSIV
jgi:alpha-1,3-rhamnosyltransferase